MTIDKALKIVENVSNHETLKLNKREHIAVEEALKAVKIALADAQALDNPVSEATNKEALDQPASGNG